MRRRTFLADIGLGFTGVALGAMLHRDGRVRANDTTWAPPDGKPHHAPKAKSVIWIFLSGGVSQLESFDPELARAVELRFFGGLSLTECARTLGMSQRTFERRWVATRTWLYAQLS